MQRPTRGVKSLTEARGNRYLTIASRLLLGAIFIVAGAGKLGQPGQFAKVVADIGILPPNWAHVYGLMLPWAEVIVGLLIVLGLLLRLSVGAGMVMTLGFVVANIYTLLRSRDAYCPSCFGELDILALPIPAALTIDIVMLLLATYILFRATNCLSLDALLWGGKRKL